jgi:hypothetical protein
MLAKFWERLRGYDKWTPAEATVQSAELSRVGELHNDRSRPQVALAWESVCQIRWQDQHQNEHTAVFRAYEESPIYQLCAGDTINIRFNPAEPSEYYAPGLIKSKLNKISKFTVYALMLIVLGIGFIVLLLVH